MRARRSAELAHQWSRTFVLIRSGWFWLYRGSSSQQVSSPGLQTRQPPRPFPCSSDPSLSSVAWNVALKSPDGVWVRYGLYSFVGTPLPEDMMFCWHLISAAVLWAHAFRKLHYGSAGIKGIAGSHDHRSTVAYTETFYFRSGHSQNSASPATIYPY